MRYSQISCAVSNEAYNPGIIIAIGQRKSYKISEWMQYNSKNSSGILCSLMYIRNVKKDTL